MRIQLPRKINLKMTAVIFFSIFFNAIFFMIGLLYIPRLLSTDPLFIILIAIFLGTTLSTAFILLIVKIWILQPLQKIKGTLLTSLSEHIGEHLSPSKTSDVIEDTRFTTHEFIKHFQAGMNERNSDHHRTLLVDLHYALEKNQFVLHYQPQIDLQTNTLIGAEVLLRWQHPEKGLIFPNEFIHLTEETGLIVAIGEWMLYAACEQLKIFQSVIPDFQFVAVNLSAVQFKQKDIVKIITEVLTHTNIDPKSLELEITESIAMSNIADALVAMHALRALGVSLSLDDFGTGYSSLSYLQHFPITKLKIDQSFIKALSLGAEDNHLPNIIIELGHLLKLRVIAEGVETQAQADYLKERHCDEVQGYLYGRSMPPEEFISKYSTK